MSASNPEFKHVDGAAYELPDLIKRLGDVSMFDPMTQVQLNIVDAIRMHARNTQEILLDGMHSIGHLMVIAADSDFEVDNGHLLQLGSLIKHLARETDFLRANESDMHCILEEQKSLATAQPAKGQGGKK